MTATKNTRPAIADGPDAGRPWYPGMVYDGSDCRCMTCDSRYCSDHCRAYTDRVYAVGSGWITVDTAARIAADRLTTIEAMEPGDARDAALYHYAMNGVRWNEHGFLPVA